MSTFLYGANVKANGIRQHYLRYGGAAAGRQETSGTNSPNSPNSHTAVIVIPGITSPAITWGFVGERLGRNFDTYILDVRGRGLSEATDDLDYGVDAQAADAIAFAAALGLSEYALVGHSMGARIGIRAARLRPPGLTRLVMIDPPVSGPGRRAYPSKLPWYIDSMALARGGCSAEEMRFFCPTWTEEQLRLRAEWLHTCNETAIVTSFDAFHTDDIHADLPHIGIPSHLIVASRGDVLLPADIEEIGSLLPQVSVAKVADAGHMIPWDNEAGFYAAFDDFLGHAV